MIDHRLAASGILVVAIVVWSLLAPVEATLGTAIRWVYLHVAFTWSGSSLVNFTGLAGLVIIVYPMPRLARWFYPAETVAVGLYGVGFLLSLISARVSWGGVLWQEPRVISSMLILGAGVAVVFILKNLSTPRLIGLVAVAYSALLSYQLAVTAVVFHPAEPIDATDSATIRVTFYGLAILAIAVGVSLVWFVGSRQQQGDGGQGEGQAGRGGKKEGPPSG